MYEEYHSSLLLVKDYCKHCVSFIEYLENFYEDDEFMDEELLENLHDNPFHHQEERIASLLDENETQQQFIYENHVTSSEFDKNLQQTCQCFDHHEYENHFKRQEEILENSCYNPQVQEKVESSCHFLHQHTSNNDHTNEEVGENFSLSLSSNLKSFE